MSHTVGVAAQTAAAALGGLLLAVVATYLFFTGDSAWLNLVVWALVGVAVGAVSTRRSTAIRMDAVIGFALVLGYELLGYRATAPLVSALLPFAAIAVVGALSMASAGLAGHAVGLVIRRGVRPRPPE